MLFASTKLAARIEAAETLLVAACAEAAQRRTGGAVLARRFSGGVAAHLGYDSPLDKVVGLGFAGPIDEAVLAEVEQEFAARGTPLPVEISCLAEAGTHAMLTRRGYALTGFENVLARRLAQPITTRAQPTADLEIHEVGEEHDARWFDTVITGFAHPDTEGVASHESYPREILERTMQDVVLAPGFVRHLASIRGEPAGGASMRLTDGIVQLCGAATLPAFRRRGVQSALLAARLAFARDRGCDLAVVTTLPGSKSQENVQRLGFELLYTRAILVLGG